MPSLKKEVWIESYSQSESVEDILIWIYQHNPKLIQAWVLEMLKPRWLQNLIRWTFRSKKDLLNKFLEELEYYGDVREDIKRKLLLSLTDAPAGSRLLQAAEVRIAALQIRKGQIERDCAEIVEREEEVIAFIERMQKEFARLGKISSRKHGLEEQLAAVDSHISEVGDLPKFMQKVARDGKVEEGTPAVVVEATQGAE
jgi:hypothetical protein